MDDIYADACYTWAKIAEKYRDDDRAMWQAFDKLRSNFYDKCRAEGQTCIPCLQDTLKRDFDLAASQEKLEAALKEIVFERFLFDVFLKGCKDKVAIGEFYEGGWPGGSEPTYAGFINTLKRVLNANTPASVRFCADVKTAAIPKGQDCNHPHIVTVSGYRQVCRQGSCSDYLRVLNSWGKGWQAANSDGWIEARDFYDYVDGGSGAIAWISKKASGEPK